MATPYARMLAGEKGVDIRSATPSGPYGEVRAADVLMIADRAVRATHLARRMADISGIDTTGIKGTGYGGKIVKTDVLAAMSKKPIGPGAALQQEGRREKMSGMRRVVAQRMLRAHTEIPSVTQTVKNNVTKLIEVRRKLNEAGERKYSFNDLILKAVVRALASHPNILVSIDGDGIVYKDSVNLGMAVAVDAGLIVPVIRNAQDMSLLELSEAARDLSEKARENRLTPDDYKGNTFTVSNLGMYDVETFTPIINQPDAAILGVCCITDELALVDGSVSVQKIMRTSLTFDHRLIDGVTAAVFQKEVKRILENPVEILL